MAHSNLDVYVGKYFKSVHILQQHPTICYVESKESYIRIDFIDNSVIFARKFFITYDDLIFQNLEEISKESLLTSSSKEVRDLAKGTSKIIEIFNTDFPLPENRGSWKISSMEFKYGKIYCVNERIRDRSLFKEWGYESYWTSGLR